MKVSEFISKFKSRYLWYNILAMAGVVVLLCVLIKVGLGIYTHHGEAIEIPDVRHKSMIEARSILESAGLNVIVGDTGYVKELPADCVLEQTPAPGSQVKSGHNITLIVNASSTPTLAIPDIVDNCSSREAMAKLKAMGFKVGMPQFVEGEKDWVYGITVDGRQCSVGDRVPVSKTVILQVGNGMVGAEDSIEVVDYHSIGHGDVSIDDDFDDFVEIP